MNKWMSVVFLSVSALTATNAMSGVTGDLELLDSNGNVAATYQAGDDVIVRVTDTGPEVNPSASVADTLTVRVTSETEDTGTPFGASEPVAGGNNTGDGVLTVLSTGYDTNTETWTITAVSQDNFIVSGSVSGNQSRQYSIHEDVENPGYTTAGDEVFFRIDQGSISFAVGDTFTFNTTAGTIVAETVTLTETDVDSGIFEGSLPVVESVTASADNFTLEVNSGDLITAFYDDASGDWSQAVQVRSTSLYAATVIKGSVILADTVWTEADSPYLITGDVTVADGVTLTILDGVDVLFLANSDDLISGHEPYDSELIVEGTLNVAGIEGNEVRFTSSHREPVTGEWGGIYIGTGSASFNHAIIEYSAYGIHAQSLQETDELIVSHSLIQENGSYGVRVDSSNDATVSISASSIINNNGVAISGDDSYAYWLVADNTISNNGAGLIVSWSHGLTVLNNTLEDNGYQGGIRFWYIRGDVDISGNTVRSTQPFYFSGIHYQDGSSSGYWMTDSISITANTIENTVLNGGYYCCDASGITVNDYGTTAPVVTGNTITGGIESGISVSNYQNTIQAVITDNTVTDVTGYGISIHGHVVPYIADNILERNSTGLYLYYDDANGNGNATIERNTIKESENTGIEIGGYANPVIAYNDIYDNGSYAIRNDTAFDIIAKNNWWGTEGTAEINSSPNPKSLSFIYDGNNDAGSYGLVNYAGWLGSGYQTGAPVSKSFTGLLQLIDSNGNVAATYQSGDDVIVRVTDTGPEVNPSASVADTLTVRVTSETEDTGTPFGASEPVAGGNNTGDGVLTVLSTGYDTNTEAWTITAVSQDNFIVSGSVSGNQSRQYSIHEDVENPGYTTAGDEVFFRIDQGSISFAVGDTFTFNTTAGTIVAETVTLTETDVDSGIFEGSLPVVESVTASADNFTLEVNSGDLITAFYDDASGDWSQAVQVRSTSLYAATVVKGSVILADTVWTEADSPYLITGDVTVADGVTLTILDGVDVLFLANSDDLISGHEPYDSELIVEGTLNVAGIEGNEVRFTSSHREPVTGEWGGIYIGTGSASFNHAIIEYSAYGIHAQSLQETDELIVSHSLIQENGSYGVRVDSSNDATVSISASSIINNNGVAISGDDSYAYWLVADNTISNNGAGLIVSWSHGLTVLNNTLEDNGYQGGIRFWYIRGDVDISGNTVRSTQPFYFSGIHYQDGSSSGYWMTDSISITANTIENTVLNGGYYCCDASGITVNDYGTTAPVVTGNTITGGIESGISVSNYQNTIQAVITDNTVTDVTGYGISIHGHVVPYIADNILERNSTGLYLYYDDANGNGNATIERNTIKESENTGIEIGGYANPVIAYNDIYDNGSYAIRNDTAFDIIAKNNWWGTEGTAEINSSPNPKSLSFIYDGNNDAGSYGLVNYAGWLGSGYQTGAPVSKSFTGLLQLIDSNGNVAATYQSGDDVIVRVTDTGPEVNPSASVADTLTVRVTSETEDTGTPFGASEPVAGGNNTGDGVLTVLSTGYDTNTEAWTITAVSQDNFIVSGSVSGNQSRQYSIHEDVENPGYTTAGDEVFFRIDQGSISFAVGDTFTFNTTAGTIVAETVTLTETDVDSGIFEGSLPVVESVTASADNFTLEVNSGDLITAFYDDASGDWSQAVQVRSTSLYAATVIKGSVILADTVWTEADSPYLITGDVTVADGVTLTILDGVDVLFLANSDDLISGHEPYDSELIVEGTLNVAGIEGNEVRFTSSHREPVTGEWGGIYIGTGSASFNHAIIEYSAYGIHAQSLQETDELIVSHSLIQENGSYGVRVDSSNDATVSISASSIINNNGVAISGDDSYAYWLVADNTISNNGAGLIVSWSHGLTVLNNTLEDNGYQGGIRFWYIRGDVDISGNTVRSTQPFYFSGIHYQDGSSSGYWMTDSISITANTIENTVLNGGYYCCDASGITVNDYGTTAPVVTGNTITGGIESGISVSNYQNTIQAVITDNTVTDVTGYGISIHGHVVPYIADNILERNSTGLYLYYDDANGNGNATIERNTIKESENTGIEIGGYANPVIAYNDIYDNGSYAIRNDTAFDIIAKNNWWGTEGTAEINSSPNPKSLSFIYDGNNDAGSYGLVNYAGWLSSALFANETPVIDGLPQTIVNVGESYLFIPASSDADVDDVLSFSITGAPAWSSFNTATGELSGNPSTDDAGTTSGIVITVTDDFETPASAALAAFSITVNQIPEAVNAVFVTPFNTAMTDLLEASDDDGDSLTYSLVSNTENGTAAIDSDSGELTYTPNEGFSGQDLLSYSVNDGYADSLVALVTITVEPEPVDALKGSNLTVLNPDGSNASGGANDIAASWNGLSTTDIADTNFTNMALSSETPFYGMDWDVHHMRVFGPGSYSFDTSCSISELEAGIAMCNGGPMLTMTVAEGQIGIHMLFDWNGSVNTDIVNVFDINAVFSTSAAGQLWTGGNPGPYPWSTSPSPETIWRLASTDNDGDGIAGVPMIDGLLAGYSFNFNLDIAEGDNNFTMLDNDGGVAGGTNDITAQWNGILTNNVSSTEFNHLMIASDTPFFFNNWSVHHARMFGPGYYVFDTSCTVAQLEAGIASCDNGPTLEMTVGVGQVGAHMLLNWGDSENIDVVNVYDINSSFTTNSPGAIWTGANYGPYPWSSVPTEDTVWRLVSTDVDGDGVAGMQMVDGALAGWNVNFNLFANAGVRYEDSDNDGVLDYQDNCIEKPNPTQLDVDRDGYGNACDGDLNNDGRVNSLDLGLFKASFFTFGNSTADFNGDQIVNSLDLGLFKQLFFKSPGPSGLVQ
ncbi:hypothetical protein BST96_17455 [Oceanicoccus sagamiensis]|uniref:Dockerin domain-containing protein n=2 Tax=Oceanicoccus sagamiensis TaxID=716816 RepID=A0A1X9NIR7_9GAMM|nr:hypothetical protein BST96_17455 [Oceanicoccus sagamiensis]